MTIINRRCFEVPDIVAVQLECTHCGATISYPPGTWKPSYLKCPNCSLTLVAGSLNQLSPELSALLALTDGLRELLTLKNPEFRLRLEFDQQN